MFGGRTPRLPLSKPVLSIIIGVFLLATAVGVTTVNAEPPPSLELNTVLMNATFKLEGDGSTGTAFVIGRPTADDPTRAYFVLVTAAHVFTAMRGDHASIILRSRDQAGRFVRRPYPIQIRSEGKALW